MSRKRDESRRVGKHRLTFTLKRGDYEVTNIEMDDYGPMGEARFSLYVVGRSAVLVETGAPAPDVRINLTADDLAWLAECAAFWGVA